MNWYIEYPSVLGSTLTVRIRWEIDLELAKEYRRIQQEQEVLENGGTPTSWYTRPVLVPEEDSSSDIDLDEDQEDLGGDRKRKREALNRASMERGTNEESRRKRSKVDIRKRHWFCTFNNYKKEDIQILKSLGAYAYAFQEEKGSEQTLHIQGVFSFKDAKKWSTMDNATGSRCYWAPCRNVAAARQYCLKEKTRVGRQWTKGYKIGIQELIDPMEGLKPYKWQQEVLDLVQLPPDDRKIHWIWSSFGRVGKSALSKSLVMNEDATYVGGKFGDAYCAIKELVLEKKTFPYIVLFDLPRFTGNKVSYIAIEGIKNGMIFSGKYQSASVLFNTPHVIVFANCEPRYEHLSKDRWQVRCLDQDTDLQHLKRL